VLWAVVPRRTDFSCLNMEAAKLFETLVDLYTVPYQTDMLVVTAAGPARAMWAPRDCD
jgi:hypothetical protein